MKLIIASTYPAFAEDLSDAIHKPGLETILTQNCIKTLAAIKKSSPDLLLVDVHLAGGSGFDILKFCKKNYPASQVILFGPADSLKHAVKALSLGAVNFLNQELDVKALAKEILSLYKKIPQASKNENQKSSSKKDELPTKKPKFVKPTIIGESKSLKSIFNIIDRIKNTDSTVLISGPSGTGKELIARKVHESSKVKDGPWVPVNCGAIPENLIESALFGYIEGAFTDAKKDRTGFFSHAVGGTIFLDEIGEMPLQMQVKLLRVLQEKEFTPVGAVDPIKANFRVIAATNRDLEKEVEKGNFREDLFFRLNVIPIDIPSLKERKEDIPSMINHFISRFNDLKACEIKGINDDTLNLLGKYEWPGNIRELENIIERMVVLKFEGKLEVEDIPQKILSRIEMASENFMENHLKTLFLPDDSISLDEFTEKIRSQMLSLANEKFNNDEKAISAFFKLDKN